MCNTRTATFITDVLVTGLRDCTTGRIRDRCGLMEVILGVVFGGFGGLDWLSFAFIRL